MFFNQNDTNIRFLKGELTGSIGFQALSWLFKEIDGWTNVVDQFKKGNHLEDVKTYQVAVDELNDILALDSCQKIIKENLRFMQEMLDFPKEGLRGNPWMAIPDKQRHLRGMEILKSHLK